MAPNDSKNHRCCECVDFEFSFFWGGNFFIIRMTEPFSVSDLILSFCSFLLRVHVFVWIVRPSSWINCAVHIPAALLPQGTKLNTNGAGDSFTAGFLVATMLRHTGMTVTRPPPVTEDDTKDSESSFERDTSFTTKNKSSKKVTPYSLYMRENYVTLKQQLKGDKKAIFTKCHEMWENESDEVKSMYERMASEENEDYGPNSSGVSLDDFETIDTRFRPVQTNTVDMDSSVPKRQPMTNQSLNLESAVQFAGLVAAHHVNMGTRDLDHLDVSSLLERAMIFPTNIQEI